MLSKKILFLFITLGTLQQGICQKYFGSSNFISLGYGMFYSSSQLKNVQQNNMVWRIGKFKQRYDLISHSVHTGLNFIRKKNLLLSLELELAQVKIATPSFLKLNISDGINTNSDTVWFNSNHAKLFNFNFMPRFEFHSKEEATPIGAFYELATGVGFTRLLTNKIILRTNSTDPTDEDSWTKPIRHTIGNTSQLNFLQLPIMFGFGYRKMITNKRTVQCNFRIYYTKYFRTNNSPTSQKQVDIGIEPNSNEVIKNNVLRFQLSVSYNLHLKSKK